MKKRRRLVGAGLLPLYQLMRPVEMMHRIMTNIMESESSFLFLTVVLQPDGEVSIALSCGEDDYQVNKSCVLESNLTFVF